MVAISRSVSEGSSLNLVMPMVRSMCQIFYIGEHGAATEQHAAPGEQHR
jgi:hypothetical protein